MKRLISAALAATLAAAVPAVAGAQEHGKVKGHDRGHDSRGNGRDRDRDRGPERRVERDIQREVERRVDRIERDVRRDVVRDRDRDFDRRPVERVVVSERGLIAGCPPGLARKNNGCLPPGQARQIARSYSRYDYLWDRRDDSRYRYDDGYLYRTDRSGSLLGYLPLLGGALIPGAAWPTQYAYEPAPAYYGDYYRLNDRYNYRYADGVLYGVDPQTQAIGQVAALLTGQTWNVGQAMPAGYDVYNVPYGYRDRYYDTPERMYRYNDGYVYQIDPTTRLVQAVVQLLT